MTAKRVIYAGLTTTIFSMYISSKYMYEFHAEKNKRRNELNNLAGDSTDKYGNKIQKRSMVNHSDSVSKDYKIISRLYLNEKYCTYNFGLFKLHVPVKIINNNIIYTNKNLPKEDKLHDNFFYVPNTVFQSPINNDLYTRFKFYQPWYQINKKIHINITNGYETVSKREPRLETEKYIYVYGNEQDGIFYAKQFGYTSTHLINKIMNDEYGFMNFIDLQFVLE